MPTTSLAQITINSSDTQWKPSSEQLSLMQNCIRVAATLTESVSLITGRASIATGSTYDEVFHVGLMSDPVITIHGNALVAETSGTIALTPVVTRSDLALTPVIAPSDPLHSTAFNRLQEVGNFLSNEIFYLYYGPNAQSIASYIDASAAITVSTNLSVPDYGKVAMVFADGSITLSETERRDSVDPDTRQLDEAIEESRQILELRDNWDGEGGEAYLESTWQRAVDILYRFHEWTSRVGKTARVPVIGPGPNGSIDLHWKSEQIELLLNVPKDTDALGEFYGDDYGKFSIKGTFDTEEIVEPLLRWLVGE